MTKETFENQSADRNLAIRAMLEKDLQERIWKDEAFLIELQANPKAVIERDYSHLLPKGGIPHDFTINIIEEQPKTLSLVLHQKSGSDIIALNEESVAGVSGGGIIGSVEKKIFRRPPHLPPSDGGGTYSTRPCSPPPTPHITASQTNCTHC